jgi:hypothetical protein
VPSFVVFFSEVGEALRGGVSEGFDGSLGVAFDHSLCFHNLGSPTRGMWMAF